MAWIGQFNPVVRDALIIAFLTAIVVVVSHLMGTFGVIAGWSRQHKEWQVGGLLTANMSLAFALAVFAQGRSAELCPGSDECRRAEEALRARE